MDVSQTTLHHLRWMLQKDHLGQDMFLLGRPGPLRRSLAMQFLQLTQRELEYVALSRDTTESDLKQRREIKEGTATYFDQSAVRAATEGRILVIEGVEKAERNVLPVLNNLLENREMHLEDGRFLIPATRYDKLLKVMVLDNTNKCKSQMNVLCNNITGTRPIGTHPLGLGSRVRRLSRNRTGTSDSAVSRSTIGSTVAVPIPSA